MKDILGASHVVAGSLYHHFPGGKDELAAACVARASRQVGDRIEANLVGRPLVEAVRTFYAAAAAGLVASDFRAGCPVGTPAAETCTLAAPMADAVAQAFTGWEGALTRGLLAHGWPEDEAEATASVLLSLYEGALLVARAERSTSPLDVAARHSCAIVAARPDPALPSPATSAGP
jgi:TetR/AcrR family transcriptional regulator, lmrAB and yxaGH operons repressor